jgi:23S rRNA (cytosine1962-C5)-methyltransferase
VPGDTVDVVSAEGRPLARAAWSPASQIRARVWSFDAEETIDHAFFKRRVAAAVRAAPGLPELAGQQGLRLIHAESDGLPGVIADRYGDTVVVQLSTAGADKWRGAIADSLHKATGCARIYERSDVEVRKLEGLEPVTGWLQGAANVTELVIEENGVRMAVDIVGGHKTGFYLDQRDNRRRVAELARDRRVLNCFCYTGRLFAAGPGRRRARSGFARQLRPGAGNGAAQPGTQSATRRARVRSGSKPTSSANCAACAPPASAMT